MHPPPPTYSALGIQLLDDTAKLTLGAAVLLAIFGFAYREVRIALVGDDARTKSRRLGGRERAGAKKKGIGHAPRTHGRAYRQHERLRNTEDDSDEA